MVINSVASKSQKSMPLINMKDAFSLAKIHDRVTSPRLQQSTSIPQISPNHFLKRKSNTPIQDHKHATYNQNPQPSLKMIPASKILALAVALTITATTTTTGVLAQTTIPPTFTCNTLAQGWIGVVSDLTDMTNAANSAITTVCAGNNPSLCQPTGSGTFRCSATVPVVHCMGCTMLASYTFSSATPPASCTVRSSTIFYFYF